MPYMTCEPYSNSFYFHDDSICDFLRLKDKGISIPDALEKWEFDISGLANKDISVHPDAVIPGEPVFRSELISGVTHHLVET